jgi:2-succinyl-5-enolpyruvyl-6-hydroxy-3-cyclohexene-1-carboxylate synthase
VLTQRGASGIDGLVAGMAGAHRASGCPGALLVGDVSVAHDLGALQTLPRDGAPLVILVLNNRGGRIFEQLPVAARAPEAMAHFLTEPRATLEPLVAAFGLPYRRADEVAALSAALDEALARRGPTVIEAVVPPGGAAIAARRLQAVADACAQEGGA